MHWRLLPDAHAASSWRVVLLGAWGQGCCLIPLPLRHAAVGVGISPCAPHFGAMREQMTPLPLKNLTYCVTSAGHDAGTGCERL